MNNETTYGVTTCTVYENNELIKTVYKPTLFESGREILISNKSQILEYDNYNDALKKAYDTFKKIIDKTNKRG